MRREARKRTWRSENFFSNSRVRLVGGGERVLVGFLVEKGEEVGMKVQRDKSVPLLHFVEAGEEGDRDEDDDCFLAVADFELDWRRPCVSFCRGGL